MALRAPFSVVVDGIRSLLRLVLRRPWLSLLAFVTFLAVVGVFTPAYAAEDGPTPNGFGDLVAGPDLTQNAHLQPTLYEAYPLGSYYFDTNRLNQTSDFIHITLNGLASVVMFLTAAVVRGSIVVVWAMFDDQTTDQLAAAISPSIGDVSAALMPWMLPTALALGAVIAYGKAKSGDGLVSHIAWLFAGGVLAVSFVTSPNLWVDTLTDARTVTAGAVMSAAATTVATTDTPFEYPSATYDESRPIDKTLRDSADGIWRAYVVTPWCLAEFGSDELCERYGKALLDQGDPDARSAWIQSTDVNHPGEYNSGGAAFRWIAGKNSYERLGMAFVALVVGVIFSSLVIIVAFGSQIALYTALLGLFVGAFFVMLWCIPGRPREWGNRWLESVIGLGIQSVLNALILAATLTLTSKAFALGGEFGWGVAAALSIGVAVAAFTMRRTLASILSMTMPGMGLTALLGRFALWSSIRTFNRASGAVGSTMRRATGFGLLRAKSGGTGDDGANPVGYPRQGRSVAAGVSVRGREVAHNKPRSGRPGQRPGSRVTDRPMSPQAARSVGRPQLRENPPPIRRDQKTNERTSVRPVLPRPVRPEAAPPKPGGPRIRRTNQRPPRPSPRWADEP